MARTIKLTLSWEGAPFSGYQRQPHAFTVQQCIEEAWCILTKEQTVAHGCSRLDAGVHAAHFVLHIKTQTHLPLKKILVSLNGIFFHHFQKPVYVYKCEDAAADFHARFDAKGKHYRYLLWHGYAQNVFSQKCYVIKNHMVDFQLIQKLAAQFVGEHDFHAFRSADCGSKKTVKIIEKCEMQQHPLYPECWMVDVYGDGFLKHMIRNMVGTLIDIATHRLPETAIVDAFAHKDRQKIGHCAPGHGLTLMQVYY